MAHAASEQSGDPQLAADGFFVNAVATESERRHTGADTEAADFAEGEDEFLGDAVAEVLLILLLAEIGERKDGDRGGGWLGGRIGGRGAAAAGPPGIEFVLPGVDGAEFLVMEAVNGEALFPLPALDGAGTALEIGGDVFPGVEAARLIAGNQLELSVIGCWLRHRRGGGFQVD